MTCSYFFYLIGEHNVWDQALPSLCWAQGFLSTRAPKAREQHKKVVSSSKLKAPSCISARCWAGEVWPQAMNFPMISAPCSHPVHGTWPATSKIAGTGFSSLAQRARILFIASFQDLSIASDKVCPKILMAWPWFASSAALPGWQRWLCPKVGGPKLWHCLVKMVSDNQLGVPWALRPCSTDQGSSLEMSWNSNNHPFTWLVLDSL